MTAFTVFRTQKIKTAGGINAAAAHNLRTRETPNADPDKENFVLVRLPEGKSAHEAVMDQIGEQTIRKNAVLAVEVLISASPEYFRPGREGQAGEWDEDRLEAWRSAMEPWIAEQFPYAVSIVLHLDEATPHYQIIDVPLDESGKLNCRGKYGGDNRSQGLAAWQTAAALPVAKLGIERGIAGSIAEHEDIKTFYGHVNRATPELPPVRTPAPKPLPEPTLAQRVPMTDAARKRREAEEQMTAARELRQSEINAQNRAKLAMHGQLAAKATITDRAKKETADYKSAAARMATENESLKAQQKAFADELRAIDVEQVLQVIYEAKLAKDSKPGHASRKWELQDGREIAVSNGQSGKVWIEQGVKGGKGAINLVMQLDALEYKAALKILSDHFKTSDLIGEYGRERIAAVRQEIRKDVQEARTAPAPMPERDDAQWPRVKSWLEQARALPAKMVNVMFAKGLVYADRRANAVFPRKNGGAFVRGTLGLKFHRTFGSKEAGPVIIPGSGDIWLTEAPIDAYSIKAMNPNDQVIALGGSLLRPHDVARWIPIGRTVRLAFDNDRQGREFDAEAKKIWPDAAIEKPPSGAKDWNEALKADPSLIAPQLQEKPPQAASEAEAAHVPPPILPPSDERRKARLA